MPAKVANVRWKCPQCGKSRWVKPHEARTRKYCSRACLHAAQRVPDPVRPKQSQRLARFGERVCTQCGATFEAKTRQQTYCSQACSVAAAQSRRRKYPKVGGVCEACGKSFSPRTPAARFCSRECLHESMRGEKASNWNGGRHVRADGYVDVYAPDHPSANKRTKLVKEHRLIMEQKLGRYLQKGETVHHINGDRADNRPENLELRRGAHGKGVIHMCADCGSHNIVTVPPMSANG